MKTTILFLSLSILSLLSIAQKDESTFYRPLQGDKAISFNITGITTMVLLATQDGLTNAWVFDFRYFLKDNVSVRLGLGVNNQTITTTTKSDPNVFPIIETENKNKTTGYVIVPGIERHLKTKSKRMDPFVGANIYLSLLGKNTVTATNNTRQTNGDYFNTTTETINPSGSLLGIFADVGFYWYFAHNVALGGELYFGYASQNTGGESKTKSTATSSVGGVVTTTETNTTTENKTKTSVIQTLSTGSILFLVKF